MKTESPTHPSTMPLALPLEVETVYGKFDRRIVNANGEIVVAHLEPDQAAAIVRAVNAFLMLEAACRRAVAAYGPECGCVPAHRDESDHRWIESATCLPCELRAALTAAQERGTE